MTEKITQLSEYFRKIPMAFLVAINTVLSIIIFIPESYAKALAVFDFRTEYRKFLGPLFLVTFSYIIARFYLILHKSLKSKKRLKEYQDRLHSLTPEEKGFLLPYIKNEKNTIHSEIGDGIASGLERKTIIYQPAQVFNALRGIPYNLQPWAREYLDENYELLDNYQPRNEDKFKTF